MKKYLLFLIPSTIFAVNTPTNDNFSLITFDLNASIDVKSDLTIINLSNSTTEKTVNKTFSKSEVNQNFIKNILIKYPTIKITNSNFQITTNYNKDGDINNYSGTMSYLLSDKNTKELNTFVNEIKNQDWKIINIKYITSDELKENSENDLMKILNLKLAKRIILIQNEAKFSKCSIRDININKQSEEYPYTMPMLFKSNNVNSINSNNELEAKNNDAGFVNNNITNKISMTFNTTLKCK